MKILILTLLSFSAMAEGEKFQEKLAERKAQATKNIDARISSLNTLKSCVSSASQKGDLKKCRQEHKARIKPLKDEWKAKRAKRKSKKKG